MFLNVTIIVVRDIGGIVHINFLDIFILKIGRIVDVVIVTVLDLDFFNARLIRCCSAAKL